MCRPAQTNTKTSRDQHRLASSMRQKSNTHAPARERACPTQHVVHQSARHTHASSQSQPRPPGMPTSAEWQVLRPTGRWLSCPPPLWNSKITHLPLQTGRQVNSGREASINGSNRESKLTRHWLSETRPPDRHRNQPRLTHQRTSRIGSAILRPTLHRMQDQRNRMLT